MPCSPAQIADARPPPYQTPVGQTGGVRLDAVGELLDADGALRSR